MRGVLLVSSPSRLVKELEEAQKREGLCNMCFLRPATKRLKTRDGMKVEVCDECYEKEKE
jgi:NMD protein affecting ribosome stability and mRNA decay